jgi:tetratricopeptide (TPR) repeat protein
VELHCVSALLILCVSASAQPALTWRLTRSEHFELYSQGTDAAARSALIWFEQLRAFYLQKTGLPPERLPPVRVISFRSASEYQPYRLGPASDAHYIGTEGRDYIVMAALDAGQFPTAAHEYAHSILRAAGLKFPLWFAEGLAEFFSTVSISEHGSTLGGDLLARSQTLRRQPWMPLAELMDLAANSPLRGDRDAAGIFYAQSWALANMLILSPQYSLKFGDLIAALSSGAPGSEALPKIYGKSLIAITGDLHAWSAIKHPPVPLAEIEAGQILKQSVAVEATVDVSPIEARALMADMLQSAGDLSRAEAIYSDLARDSPQDARVHAALGAIALAEGDKDRARREWKLAIDFGIADATLCYQYAVIGEQADVPEDDLRPALEQAVRLKPDFDDARYLLALIEKNAGRFDAAVVQLRAMRSVAPARAYNYWSAMADALIQLDRRDDARSASKRAMEYATTDAERARAAQLRYLADTDFAVQFSMGKNGRAELSTTRIPHATADFNPFIEPGDKIRHVEGALREIDCSGALTRFVVDTSEGPVTLAIPDPGHVQMRNAPSEFTCGPQQSLQVAVDYAISAPPEVKADGLVRGMQFK